MKTIRIWNGPSVLTVVTVYPEGTSVTSRTGGAEDSSKVDIEIDPYAGLIVDHSVRRSPVNFREVEE